MKVIAKFVCAEVKKYKAGVYDKNGKYVPGILYNYRFTVVTGDTEENKKFFASTPSGSIELSSIRSDFFEIGDEFYVEFTPAKKEESSV